jgi:putative hydrolase of the HAD superfamily
VLKAVTFDLGDTLIDYGPMRYGPMMRYGVACAREYLESLGDVAGPPRRRLARRLCRAVRRTWLRSKLLLDDRDAGEALAGALAGMGVRLDAERRKEVVRQFFAALWRLTRPMPGAAEVLERLAARGLRLAVLSNTVLPPWLLDESLERVGLLGRLPQRFYSCALGCKKPGRRIFRLAREGLGVERDELLHVGDRYTTDVWGARRAGVRVCLKRSYQSIPLPPVRPDFRIRHMAELLPVIDRLTGVV